jgi:hypothetical protein
MFLSHRDGEQVSQLIIQYSNWAYSNIYRMERIRITLWFLLQSLSQTWIMT